MKFKLWKPEETSMKIRDLSKTFYRTLIFSIILYEFFNYSNVTSCKSPKKKFIH